MLAVDDDLLLDEPWGRQSLPSFVCEKDRERGARRDRHRSGVRGVGWEWWPRGLAGECRRRGVAATCPRILPSGEPSPAAGNVAWRSRRAGAKATLAASTPSTS